MQITLLKMRVMVVCEALFPASSFAATEILVAVSQDAYGTFLNADAQVLDAVKSLLRRSLIGNREHHRAHRTGSGLTKLCRRVKHERLGRRKTPIRLRLRLLLNSSSRALFPTLHPSSS